MMGQNQILLNESRRGLRSFCACRVGPLVISFSSRGNGESKQTVGFCETDRGELVIR
jgi:hypothetical protein